MSELEMRDAKVVAEPAQAKEDSDLNFVQLAAGGRPSNLCSLDTTTKELAKFGPYTTTQIDTEQFCPGSAHPSDSHKFLTIDPFTSEPMKLTDFFKPEDVYSALMENETFRNALYDKGFYPSNYKELEQILNMPGPGVSVETKYMQEGPVPTVEANLNERMLSNFAFKQVIADHDGAEIETRLLLDYGCEATRNSLPYIDLTLPMTPALSKTVFDADSLKNGFLMKNSKQFGAGSYNHKDIPSPFENGF